MSKLYDIEQKIKRLEAEYAACDDFVTARHEIKEKLDAAKVEHFDESKKVKPHDIYDLVCFGDPIADAELTIGIRHFGQMEELLSASGPVFKLAANEAARIHDRLAGFKKARRER